MTSVLHAPYFIARHQLPDLNLRTRFFSVGHRYAQCRRKRPVS